MPFRDRRRALLPPSMDRYLRDRNWSALRDVPVPWPNEEVIAPELGDVLIGLPPHRRPAMLSALPDVVAAEVISLLPREVRTDLLNRTSDPDVARLLTNLAPDDRTALLHDLPAEAREHLIALLPPAERRAAHTLLAYPPRSVGRLMNPDVLRLQATDSVAEALTRVRRLGRDSEAADVLFVVDDAGRLLDDVPLRRLVLADPNEPIAALMDRTVVRLSPTDHRREAVHAMRRYDRVALPVVDHAGVLLGIVTIDDVFDVAEAHTTSTFHRQAGVEPSGSPYARTSPFALYRARIGWLAVLLAVNLMSAGVITAFEDTLTAVVTLAAFIPLIIDTGGNVGAQVATVVIRALGVGEIRLRDVWRTLRKELIVGAAVGLTLGAAGFALAFARGGWWLAWVVAFTMLTLPLLTNLLGALLPFAFVRARFDPAIASGPLLTSLADVLGLLLYFAFASTLLLPHLQAP